MNNKAAVIVAKDADVYLPLIYALGQLECFLQSWYLKIDYNQLINIKMIYNNSVSEIFASYVLSLVVTPCPTNLMLKAPPPTSFSL